MENLRQEGRFVKTASLAMDFAAAELGAAQGDLVEGRMSQASGGTVSQGTQAGLVSTPPYGALSRNCLFSTVVSLTNLPKLSVKTSFIST